MLVEPLNGLMAIGTKFGCAVATFEIASVATTKFDVLAAVEAI